jgi:hypothetical protein
VSAKLFPALCLLLGILTPKTGDAVDWLVPAEVPTIQQAIDLAVSGDQILVAPGTYLENLNFNGKGVVVSSTDGPAVTIIDGSTLTKGPDLGATVMFVSGETSATTLNGFTLQGGSGNVDTDVTGTYRRGGGIHISASSPTLTNCILTSNSTDFGSGLYAQGTLTLDLQNLQFLGNSGLEGSGIYLVDCGNVTIHQCVFEANQSMTAGGAISINTSSQIQLSQSTFTANTSLIGGAVYCRLSTLLLEENQFRSNEATLLGGGVTLYQSTTTSTQCVFQGNSANHGGGIGLDGGSLVLNGNLMTGNQASTAGAAISSTINLVDIEIRRSTLTGNSSTNGSPGVFYPPLSAGGATSTLTVSHSILWNPPGLEIDIPTFAQVDHSVVSSGYPGTAILITDPLFTDPVTEDFTLSAASPCIDAGDLLQYLDPDGTAPDLGAFFFDQRPPALPFITCQIADPCGTSVSVSWDAGMTPPDSFQFSAGTDLSQLVPLAALPGTATSYTFDPGTSGFFSICVEPILGGLTPEAGPTCCEIEIPAPTPPLPIENLQCAYDPMNCFGSLSWSNGTTYSTIELNLNGQVLVLPGSVNSASLPLTPGVVNTLALVAQMACGTALPAVECQLLCPVPEPRFIRGDANMDSLLNMADVFSQLLLLHESGPGPCPDAHDTNDDGALDISDPIFLLLFLFGNGQNPPSPGLNCGIDPGAADSLDCQMGLNCP